MSTIINASTSSGLIQTGDTSGTLVLQSNGTTQQTIDSTGSYGQLKSGTAVASTSGTNIDFSIPSWAKRITVMLNGVSLTAGDDIVVRLGTAGGIVASGYECGYTSGAGTGSTTTLGFFVTNGLSAANTASGIVTIANISGNVWVESGVVTRYSASGGGPSAGKVDIGAALTTVRITNSGASTFDAGSINILYEG